MMALRGRMLLRQLSPHPWILSAGLFSSSGGGGKTTGAFIPPPSSVARGAGGDVEGAPSYTWRSPAPRLQERQQLDIPIKPRVNLTKEEVMNALEANGALDIKVIDLEGKSTLCSAMIFCTGLSGRHMRRLSDTISRALKKRKLVNAPGRTGAEGYDGSDWHVVDCWNLIVHIMDADTRESLDLETLWSNMEIPGAREFGDGFVEDAPGPTPLRGRKRRPWEINDDDPPELDGEIDGEFDIVRAASAEEEKNAYQDMLQREMEAAKEAARRRRS